VIRQLYIKLLVCDHCGLRSTPMFVENMAGNEAPAEWCALHLCNVHLVSNNHHFCSVACRDDFKLKYASKEKTHEHDG
jgi:hypothetical protein